jgi:acetyltransferase-like isoleucine patch superfamily enzyme
MRLGGDISLIGRGARALLHAWRIRRDPVGYARSLGVRVGRDCRLLSLERETFGSEPFLVRLGDYVTLTAGVRFVTHDGGVWVFRREHPDIDLFAPIEVGSNVFIGSRSMILPGVSIGDDCVIGAGSVVTRSIPSGMVAAGVPARPIRTVREYWERVQGRAMHIRSLPRERKIEWLIDHFELGEG